MMFYILLINYFDLFRFFKTIKQLIRALDEFYRAPIGGIMINHYIPDLMRIV